MNSEIQMSLIDKFVDIVINHGPHRGIEEIMDDLRLDTNEQQFMELLENYDDNGNDFWNDIDECKRFVIELSKIWFILPKNSKVPKYS